MLKIEDTTPEASLPNWQRVQDLLQLSPKASSKLLPSEKAKNDKLLVTHKTVYVRLTFANFHLSILKQANNDSVKRAVFEDTVINIVSSLQALAHLLNELYEFGIKDASVVIDHLQYNNEAERKKASKRCLRCKLRDHNEDIAYLLDGVLKTGTPVNSWYHALIEYRHQILHASGLAFFRISSVLKRRP